MVTSILKDWVDPMTSPGFTPNLQFNGTIVTPTPSFLHRIPTMGTPTH